MIIPGGRRQRPQAFGIRRPPGGPARGAPEGDCGLFGRGFQGFGTLPRPAARTALLPNFDLWGPPKPLKNVMFFTHFTIRVHPSSSRSLSGSAGGFWGARGAISGAFQSGFGTKSEVEVDLIHDWDPDKLLLVTWRVRGCRHGLGCTWVPHSLAVVTLANRDWLPTSRASCAWPVYRVP